MHVVCPWQKNTHTEMEHYLLSVYDFISEKDESLKFEMSQHYYVNQV